MDDFLSANTALGLILGLILGIVGNYLFEGLGFKQRAAKLSKRRATKRLATLRARLKTVEAHESNKPAFAVYLIGRLVLVNALWIAQEICDYLIGLVGNATYGLSLFGRSFTAAVGPDVINTGIYAFGSLLGATFLIVVFNVAYRTYRIWRVLENSTAWKVKVVSEINDLEAVIAAP